MWNRFTEIMLSFIEEKVPEPNQFKPDPGWEKKNAENAAKRKREEEFHGWTIVNRDNVSPPAKKNGNSSKSKVSAVGTFAGFISGKQG